MRPFTTLDCPSLLSSDIRVTFEVPLIHTRAGVDDFPPGIFDSLAAVEMTHTLARMLGLQLPATLMFDYPSVGSMATFIATRAAAAGSVAAARALAPSPAVLRLSSAAGNFGGVVCVSSVSVQGPLPAVNVFAGPEHPDAISLVPFERWDLEAQVAHSFGWGFGVKCMRCGRLLLSTPHCKVIHCVWPHPPL